MKQIFRYSHDKSLAIKIALIYTLIGCLWIMFSDKLLAILIKDVHLLTTVQTFKGWFYVFATAWLLYHLIAANFKTRNRSLQAQLESEKRYRNLFDNSPIAILMIEPYSGEIADANAAAGSYFGKKRDELVTTNVEQILRIPQEQLIMFMKENRWGQLRQLYLGPERNTEVPGVIEVFGGRIESAGISLLCLIIRDVNSGKAASEAAAAVDTHE